MKKFFKNILAFGFWGSFICMASAAEADKWGLTILFLAIFAGICFLTNKIDVTTEIDEIDVEEK